MLVEVAQLSLDELAPVYVFAGQDAYMKQKVTQAFQSKVSEAGRLPDFDYFYFKSEDLNIFQVMESCLSMPFMQSKVLVLCDGADVLAKNIELLDYLKNPSETTCLVLFFQDKRKLSKAIKTVARVGSLDALDHKGFAVWMQDYMKTHGVQLECLAKSLIQAQYKGNLLAMEREVEKLVTFAGPNAIITAESVKQLLVTVEAAGVFELIEAMTSQKYGLFMNRLQAMLHAETSGHEVIGVLVWHFKRLWSVRQFLNQGLSPWEMAQRLHMKEWALNKVLPQVKRLKKNDFEQIFSRLYHLDVALKNNRLPSKVLLQAFALA